jgi:hypothetical protein
MKDVGADKLPAFIKNNEEYKLRQNERLYIEYTPSSTTEDSTAQSSITEVYGDGTVIRPRGFETGLLDSTVYGEMGNTRVKNVPFKPDSGNIVNVNLYSLGASEQIEIREPAQVVLSKESLSGTSAVYIYKNFNNCPELEKYSTDNYGNRINNSYTLKDGEYIFYTDYNKADFAYFTSGTQVTLNGDREVVLPEFDIIELSTIFDSGLQVIPWKYLPLNADNELVFQEFQYITLGPEDTIKSAILLDINIDEKSGKKYLDNKWKFCSDVEYIVADEPDTKVALPAVNLPERGGNGWEACSTLELDVSAGTPQTLRSTDKVKTSITLTRTRTTGGLLSPDIVIAPKAGIGISTPAQPLSFKTNLDCQACGTSINIKDVIYNPNNLSSFQLKMFAATEPAIIETKCNTVIPQSKNNSVIDINMLAGRSDNIIKDYAGLWSKVSLDEIRVGTSTDKALCLPVSLLPNTYGVFCLYISGQSAKENIIPKIWIEAIPGTRVEDITLLNTDNATIEYLDPDTKEKLHKLYLNPGINCVRINKTGRLFIKSANDVSGTLCFDSLRLVNSQMIKYTNNGKEIPLYTKGLNLTQLGYLDTSGTDKPKLDSASKAILQAAYVEKTYNDINTELLNVDSYISEGYKALIDCLPKTQTLINAERSINEELDTLSSNKRLPELVAKYKDVRETLENEKSLLEALKNNAEADYVEQQLAKLLDSFNSVEVTQLQLFEELATIRTKAEASTANISNKEALVDFRDSSAEEKEKALSDVKAAVTTKVESYFLKKLSTISDNLDKVTNSTSKNALLAVLANLQAAATSETRVILQAKVNELSSIVDTDAIDGLLDAITTATLAPDYPQLLLLLQQLRSIVDSKDIKVLVSEIAKAVNDRNDAQLAALLTPLFDVNGDFNSQNTITSSDVLTKIDNAYTLVSKNVTSDTAVPEVTNVIEGAGGLKEVISTDYLGRLSTVLTEIKNKLGDITTILGASGISSIVDNLSDSDDDQVSVIVDMLESLNDERNAFISGSKVTDGTNIAGLADFNNFENWEDNTCAEFIKEAIVAVWPSYVVNMLRALLDDIDKAFDDALEDDLDGFAEREHTLLQMLDKKTDLIARLVDADAVKTLFKRIKTLISFKSQRKTAAELIADISGFVQDSEELTTAIAATSGNHIIETIINDWQAADKANDVVQKQQKQTALKEALAKAIETDEQLFNIMSKLLFPNMTRLTTELDKSDVLYFKLLVDNGVKDANGVTIGAITEIKNQVLKLDFENLDLEDIDFEWLKVAVDDNFIDTLKPTLEGFRTALKAFKVANSSLLPKELIKYVGVLQDAIETSEAVKADVRKLSEYTLTTMSSTDMINNVDPELMNGIVKEHFKNLYEMVLRDENMGVIEPGYEDAFSVLTLENQLLADIKKLDTNREFYYSVPVEDRLAIELNENDKALNTLMNPLTNYDTNNVNNSFVISKLDIDYLNNGIQIARSSRLN